MCVYVCGEREKQKVCVCVCVRGEKGRGRKEGYAKDVVNTGPFSCCVNKCF